MDTLDAPKMTDPTSVSPRPVGIRFGAIASLIMILIGLATYLGGLVDYSNQNSAINWIVNLLNWAVMAGAMFLAMKKHREDLGGYMTFGRGFSVGFWAALIMSLITAVWAFLFFTFIAPDIITTIMDATADKMLEQGQSEEQVEQAMQYTKMFMTPVSFTIFGFIGTLMTGIIIALITAAISQRKPPVNTTF